VAAAIVAVPAVPASAEPNVGPYIAESFGVGRARGDLAGVVGTAMHERVSMGMRLGDFAIEPYVASDLQTSRDGAFLHLVGGSPRAGAADLETIGLDAKYIVPVHSNVDLYVRGGPMVTEGNGALEGYRGRGVGFAGGVQVTGQVRALGFLWAPLFFLKRGPMATGALYLDAGYDVSTLHRAGDPSLDAEVVHVNIGFAVGTAF
jgi:hypothetical protein